jgi:hypothetical protein
MTERVPTFTENWLRLMYGPNEALDWVFTRPGVFERWERKINVNGSRWSYDEPTEPGPIDAGMWCPYDPGYAEAYDDGSSP